MKPTDLYPRGFRRVVVALVLMLAVVSADGALVQVSVDRPDGVYAAGSPASFTITTNGTLPAGGIDASCVFLRDGLITTSTSTVHLSGSPVVISKTLDQPGQLMLTVSWTTPSAGYEQIGAIFDPYNLQPGLGCPADFDAFWAAQKDSLAGDYTPEIVPLTPTATNTDLVHVKIPMPEGNPVQGYMTKPRGAAPRSLAAIAYVHEGGVRSSYIPSAYICNGSMGVIAFDFNAHGIDDGQPASYYTSLSNGALKYYRTGGWDNRDTVYFRGMYKRALRAVDFLTKQPEWDGKTLVVFGRSQGGAQAIVIGGLEPRVSVVVAGIPALCDLNAWKNHRVDGWPHIVIVGSDGNPVDPKTSEAACYYDSINFARRVSCDAFFMTGLIDVSCPAVTVLPAYNLLQSARKKIVIAPNKAHDFADANHLLAEFFVKEYFDAAHITAAKLLVYE